jgi:hypothetical protein
VVILSAAELPLPLEDVVTELLRKPGGRKWLFREVLASIGLFAWGGEDCGFGLGHFTAEEPGCFPRRPHSSLWVRLLLRLRRSVDAEELMDKLAASFSSPDMTCVRDGRFWSFFGDGSPRMDPVGLAICEPSGGIGVPCILWTASHSARPLI